jgi:TonB-dependent SusC/RagA subfamily outer membrane receptor
MAALLDKVAYQAAIKDAANNNLKKVQYPWDKKCPFDCIVYSLRQMMSACAPVPMPKGVKGMFSIRTILILFLMMFSFHMFSLSAQTPRKDSGAEGLLAISGTVVSSTDGKPIQGVSIQVQGEKGRASSKNDGSYSLPVSNPKGTVSFSHMGFKRLELPYVAGVSLRVKLIPIENQLEEVEVVSTGYQKIPKERATGSFVQVDNKLLNRRVSTNILDRLEGVTSGVNFNRSSGGSGGMLPPNEQTGLSIRGRSTIDDKVSADPLIILDNFPFEGGLDQINPNDVESITVLRDAAAASIWGARSGNGVIVISTKKAAFNEKTKVDFNTATIVGSRPNFKYSRSFIPSAQFMVVEKQLFDKGFYDDMLSNTSTYPVVSPYVELLNSHRSGNLTDNDLQLMESQFARRDAREETAKYFYQTSRKSQYALNIRSGGPKSNTYFSVGYDDNREAVQRANLQRWTMTLAPQFKI